MLPVIPYLKYICTGSWIWTFFTARTAPLETPPHFREFPHVTDKECTHCFQCMMICPAPDAIEVIHQGDPPVWSPRVHPGHCIRCGLCIEICPELVLDGGRVHTMNARDSTYMQFTFHIQVNPVTCMGCGVCTVACPVNKEIDPQLAAKGTSMSPDVIMHVTKGLNVVYHEDKCTGCKTCEEQCPTRSIKVSRILEPLQVVVEEN